MAPHAKRVLLIVLDGVGIGSLDETAPDPGADTFASVASAVGQLRLPHLTALGLSGLIDASCLVDDACLPEPVVIGSSARLVPSSAGKDTLTGHWELAGLPTDLALRTFPGGLPSALLESLSRAFGSGVIGGAPASGTEIIARLGPEHLATGKLIVYTSADSVLQIAAHDAVLTADELYHCCELASDIALNEPWLLGRVIARPFTGAPGDFRRTAGRRDYSLPPPGPTVLDAAKAAGIRVIAVGKVSDVFAGRGISESYPAYGNAGVIEVLHRLLDRPPQQRELVFANLNDFDTVYGHRRDAVGFAAALEGFDADLGRMLSDLGRGEILLVTADHGCDPTYQGTDHTREDVPLFIAGTGWPPACYGSINGLTAVSGLISAAFGLDCFYYWPRLQTGGGPN